MPGIFDKVRLRPAQLRTVAERRFGDAHALRCTGNNERANGVLYLGGFVIECLLKAQLLESYPWLQRARGPDGRSPDEQRLWSLCYRSHDLDEILSRLPGLLARLVRLAQMGQAHLLRNLKAICGQWTVHARYSPQSAIMVNASAFLDRVKEIKRCLR